MPEASSLFRPSQKSLRGTVVGLILATLGCGNPPGGPLVALELEAQANTLDGCTACGCRSRGELVPGAERAWWVSFGLVDPNAQGSWRALGGPSHCGTGSFEEVASNFLRTVGTPYVIFELSTTAAVGPDGEVDLESHWSTQKLSGFGEDGQAVYTRSSQQRKLRFEDGAGIVLPLLLADPDEKQSFGVHDVVLRLRAETVGFASAASWGTLAVSADVPGADILLDGGLVGRIQEGSPTWLYNVLAGSREIRVRDFSGREAQSQVVIEKSGTLEVTLEVLDLRPPDQEMDLVLIGENPQGHQEYWRVRDAATLVKIPAGEFLMGSPEGQGEPHERPQHRVYVSDFLIDKTEVTWRQFRKFADVTGSPLPPAPVSGTPDHYPASFILWEEAKRYCEWVGGRLPTEAQWEKAARGTDGRNYPWGAEWDARRCNSISGGLHRPESVGSYTGCVSPYGVLDMAGSMWEWCADWYGESYYAQSSPRDPSGPASGDRRVMRGGAWMTQPLWLRTAYRRMASPTSRNLDHGFRCAQDAPE